MIRRPIATRLLVAASTVAVTVGVLATAAPAQSTEVPEYCDEADSISLYIQNGTGNKYVECDTSVANGGTPRNNGATTARQLLTVSRPLEFAATPTILQPNPVAGPSVLSNGGTAEAVHFGGRQRVGVASERCDRAEIVRESGGETDLINAPRTCDPVDGVSRSIPGETLRFELGQVAKRITSVQAPVQCVAEGTQVTVTALFNDTVIGTDTATCGSGFWDIIPFFTGEGDAAIRANAIEFSADAGAYGLKFFEKRLTFAVADGGVITGIEPDETDSFGGTGGEVPVSITNPEGTLLPVLVDTSNPEYVEILPLTDETYRRFQVEYGVQVSMSEQIIPEVDLDGPKTDFDFADAPLCLESPAPDPANYLGPENFICTDGFTLLLPGVPYDPPGDVGPITPDEGKQWRVTFQTWVANQDPWAR